MHLRGIKQINYALHSFLAHYHMGQAFEWSEWVAVHEGKLCFVAS